MTVPIQQYRPVGTLAVEIAVGTTLVSGVVTTIQINLRSRAVIATPATFITDNSLEPEILSRAGLSEDWTVSSYVLDSSSQQSIDYIYVLTASVSS